MGGTALERRTLVASLKAKPDYLDVSLGIS
jgi:hypothetical protein